MTEPNTALKDIASRRLYQPYFKARWQNMQNIVNDSFFFSVIKEPYLSYYQAYIRQWLQWSTGFVPMLHRQDFFSTGMGYTVCDIFARECMSGGYRLNTVNRDFKILMEDWAEVNDFTNMLNEMFFFANAGGNAILCLTPINGEMYPSAIPINRVTFQISRKGDITSAVILNRFTAGQSNYYAREIRLMDNGKPYYKVEVCNAGSTVLSPSWSTETLKRIPLQLKAQWEYTYGDIKPNTWYQIPKIKSLGLYNVRNKSVAVAIADLPGYSDSTLHTALDILYSIDYNYTQQQLDQYWGRTRVLIPKAMQTAAVRTNSKVIVAEGVAFVEAIKAPLEDEVYSQVPGNTSIDKEPMKPVFIQPDLRGEAHKYIRDADLEILASKVGLSSSTLANHLSYNKSKTATEVTAEQDTTEVSVNNKRSLASRAINAMLKDIAVFYGSADELTILWNRAGVNSVSENKGLLEEYQAGTLPLDEYLRKRWSDLEEDDIKVWVAKIETIEQEKQKREMFGGIGLEDNYFGDKDNENSRQRTELPGISDRKSADGNPAVDTAKLSKRTI